MARARGARVVITGLGQVSAAGATIAAFELAVIEARSGIRRLPNLRAPGYEDPIGAALSDFDPGQQIVLGIVVQHKADRSTIHTENRHALMKILMHGL